MRMHSSTRILILGALGAPVIAGPPRAPLAPEPRTAPRIADSGDGPETPEIPGQLNCFATSCTPVPCYALPFEVADLADIVGFTQAFLDSDTIADIVEPFGVIDLRDLGSFIDQFLNGCP